MTLSYMLGKHTTLNRECWNILFFFNTIQNLNHILFQLPTVSNKEIGPFLYQNLIHHSSQLHGDNKGVYKTSLYNNYRNLIECTCLLLCVTYVKKNTKKPKIIWADYVEIDCIWI